MIKSLKRKKWFIHWKEKILKPWKKKWWHCYINLTSKSTYIHRMVAIHFIPNPLNLPLVCHKDETLDENWMLYNWMDNLFWWTYKDNMQDMINKWRDKCNFKLKHPHKWVFWKLHYRSKIVTQYRRDWEFIKEWWSIVDIEKELWIKRTNISTCCTWRRKTAWWFIWKYKN